MAVELFLYEAFSASYKKAGTNSLTLAVTPKK
jgi:hypothetical protein